MVHKITSSTVPEKCPGKMQEGGRQQRKGLITSQSPNQTPVMGLVQELIWADLWLERAVLSLRPQVVLKRMRQDWGPIRTNQSEKSEIQPVNHCSPGPER